ncbi:DMT family transporter [Streptomyces paradoxus]|uniref:Drug/metabolite transporter (DMT)-like permease n=1 Tax=Streptomyces paradoxus TaxID=66375 RepID=A0A7W9T7D9_9ACTN|nr:DMT family transporter [Streptomyces paradoxus]MBB6074297.1 drug/metabolite transporter (DMT)-like permease [Streptomyces paradoxus]
MSALALSVLLSLVSAFAYAGGAIVQERVAESSPGEQYAPLRRPGWWAAVGLNGLGGVLHVVALAYGPLSLVQPLGALTIVVALPMAALFVGRKAGATAWRGAIMATVGLAGLLSLVAASDARSLDTAQRVAVAVVTAGVVVALMVAARAAHRHPAVRSMLLATASGIAFGMSSVFTKTVAVDWTGGVSAADVPSLAVIGVLATAGMLLSQAAYRGAGLAAPLATLTVVNPVVAAAVGITMFGETFRYGTAGTVLALGCGVVAAGGLILLTTERLTHEQPDAVPARPAEAPGGAGARSLPAEGPRRVPERAGRVGLSEPVGGPESTRDVPGQVPAGAQAGLRVEDVLVRKPVTTAVLVPGTGAPTAVIVPRPDETAGVRVPEPVAAAPVSGADAPAAVIVPRPQATATVSVPDTPAAVLAPRPEAAVDVLASEPVATAVPDTTAAVLVPGPGAAATGGADASYEGGEPSVAAASDDDRPLSYVPFYGIPYVPLPVIDRHRMRVRS